MIEDRGSKFKISDFKFKIRLSLQSVCNYFVLLPSLTRRKTAHAVLHAGLQWGRVGTFMSKHGSLTAKNIFWWDNKLDVVLENTYSCSVQQQANGQDYAVMARPFWLTARTGLPWIIDYRHNRLTSHVTLYERSSRFCWERLWFF